MTDFQTYHGIQPLGEDTWYSGATQCMLGRVLGVTREPIPMKRAHKRRFSQ